MVVRLGWWIGRALDVVEPDNGHVLGDAQAVVDEGSDGADGGDVVKCHQSGEFPAALDQLVGRRKAELRRGDAQLELNARAVGSTVSFRSCATAIRQFQRSSASEL